MNRTLPGLAGLAASLAVAAQEAPGGPAPAGVVVVTGTRVGRAPLDVPASVDVIGPDRLHDGQLQVNLSETLPALPGVVANHRQNYAQDLQVSVRGFGARSTFGVRGVRVIVDGIPATMPDGQAQISHIDLATAERIEVLRGPFSVLYGNSSGGVIQVFTATPAPGHSGRVDLAAGGDGTRRVAASAQTAAGALGTTVGVTRFDTRGYRDHSAATRVGANAKLRWSAGPRTTLTLVGNVLDMPATQDPLGLTRAQMQANPRGVDPAAIAFDTRKSVDQAQGGFTLDHAIGAASALRFTAYAGRRGTQQFQSIPTGPQMAQTHPGGVIDLGRAYGGLDARWTWDGRLAGAPFTLVAGANADRLSEDRRGYRNFAGAGLGVQGELRRDETNRVGEDGVFAQGEWRPHAQLRVLAGVRASRIVVRSHDHYVSGANPDDSGNLRFSAATPVAGATWRASTRMSLYAAAGRGFETPTVNELAYRPGGATGLNAELRAARSDNYEVGAKWTDAAGWRAAAALFRISTRDEIVAASNAGGRSTFRNAGDTRRVGVELQASRDWASGFGLSLAAAHLRAEYAGASPSAGNSLPGVPRATAYAQLRWRGAGLDAALEARHSSRIFVNDANSDAASAYTVASLNIGTTWRAIGHSVRPYLRVDNLFDRRYAGSVIVNEGNTRYFEPAAGRTVLAGIAITLP